MPIGTINTAKELSAAPRPLLLATVTFLDGTILRLATDGLRTADALGRRNASGSVQRKWDCARKCS